MKYYIFLILLPIIQLQGWASGASIYYNPTIGHTVALLGDRHVLINEDNKQEQEFINNVYPYINHLVLGEVAHSSFIIESNISLVSSLLVADNKININSMPIPLLAGLSMLSYPLSFFLEPTTHQTFLDYFKTFSKVYDNTLLLKLQSAFRHRLGLPENKKLFLISSDTRFGPLRLLSRFHVFLNLAAQDLHNDFFARYPLIGSYSNSPIGWVDNLFFNNNYQNYLFSVGLTEKIYDYKKMFFTMLHKVLEKNLLSLDWVINDALSALEPQKKFLEYFNSFIQTSGNESVKKFFNEWLKDFNMTEQQLLQLGTYSINKPTIYYSLINFAEYFRSFSALANLLNYSDIKNISGNIPFQVVNLNQAIFFILLRYSDLGFFKSIMDEADKKNNSIVYAGWEHGKKLGELFKMLGYQELYFVENPQGLDGSTLSNFFNLYFKQCAQYPLIPLQQTAPNTTK